MPKCSPLSPNFCELIPATTMGPGLPSFRCGTKVPGRGQAGSRAGSLPDRVPASHRSLSLPTETPAGPRLKMSLLGTGRARVTRVVFSVPRKERQSSSPRPPPAPRPRGECEQTLPKVAHIRTMDETSRCFHRKMNGEGKSVFGHRLYAAPGLTFLVRRLGHLANLC